MLLGLGKGRGGALLGSRGGARALGLLDLGSGLRLRLQCRLGKRLGLVLGSGLELGLQLSGVLGAGALTGGGDKPLRGALAWETSRKLSRALGGSPWARV